MCHWHHYHHKRQSSSMRVSLISLSSSVFIETFMCHCHHRCHLHPYHHKGQLLFSDIISNTCWDYPVIATVLMIVCAILYLILKYETTDYRTHNISINLPLLPASSSSSSTSSSRAIIFVHWNYNFSVPTCRPNDMCLSVVIY